MKGQGITGKDTAIDLHIFFNNLRDLDYAERLRRLGLWTLEKRRNRADLIEVYKIVNGLSNLPVSTFFEFRTDIRTRGHLLKPNTRRSNRDPRLHFFSERVDNRWNQLPSSVFVSYRIISYQHCGRRLVASMPTSIYVIE